MRLLAIMIVFASVFGCFGMESKHKRCFDDCDGEPGRKSQKITHESQPWGHEDGYLTILSLPKRQQNIPVIELMPPCFLPEIWILVSHYLPSFDFMHFALLNKTFYYIAFNLCPHRTLDLVNEVHQNLNTMLNDKNAEDHDNIIKTILETQDMSADIEDGNIEDDDIDFVTTDCPSDNDECEYLTFISDLYHDIPLPSLFSIKLYVNEADPYLRWLQKFQSVDIEIEAFDKYTYTQRRDNLQDELTTITKEYKKKYGKKKLFMKHLTSDPYVQSLQDRIKETTAIIKGTINSSPFKILRPMNITSLTYSDMVWCDNQQGGDSKYGSFANIANFTNLMTLTLNSAHISNKGFTYLSFLTNLTHLGLSTDVPDFSNRPFHPYGKLINLTSLNLSCYGSKRVKEVCNLSYLTNLKMLNLSGALKVKDTDHVTTITLDFLGPLVNMEILDLSYIDLSKASLTLLQNMSLIHTLKLEESELTESVFQTMPALPSLTKLNISMNVKIHDNSTLSLWENNEEALPIKKIINIFKYPDKPAYHLLSSLYPTLKSLTRLESLKFGIPD